MRPYGLEVIELGLHGDGDADGDDDVVLDCCVGVLYYAVVVGFLGPFVDYGAGEDGGHVGGEDSEHVTECTGTDGDTTVFGEESWDGVALELCDAVCVA